MFVFKYIYRCEHGGWRSMLGVFLYWSPLYSLRQNLLLNLELTDSARQAGQRASGILHLCPLRCITCFFVCFVLFTWILGIDLRSSCFTDWVILLTEHSLISTSLTPSSKCNIIYHRVDDWFVQLIITWSNEHRPAGFFVAPGGNGKIIDGAKKKRTLSFVSENLSPLHQLHLRNITMFS